MARGSNGGDSSFDGVDEALGTALMECEILRMTYIAVEDKPKQLVSIGNNW